MKFKIAVHTPRTRGRARARLLAKNLHLRGTHPQAFGVLLPPAALMSAVLGAWRIGADLKFTNSFPIEGGLFAHWMTWMSAAAILEILAYRSAHAKDSAEREK